MSEVYLSVVEAAEMLGVHPQRIHQRIRDGSLPAQKVGRQWAIGMDDLRHASQLSRGPGRALSARSAWNLLAAADGDEVVASLSPSARSRARGRLRELLSKPLDAAELDNADVLNSVAAALSHALRNRAHRVAYFVSPRDLPDMRNDQRIHLSGISLPQSNLSSGDVIEGYVAADDVPGLFEDYLLSPSSRGRANVIFHVVPSDIDNAAVAALHVIVRSPLALAADLAEHGGIRERNEAVRSLSDLRASFAKHEPGAVGADRD